LYRRTRTVMETFSEPSTRRSSDPASTSPSGFCSHQYFLSIGMYGPIFTPCTPARPSVVLPVRERVLQPVVVVAERVVLAVVAAAALVARERAGDERLRAVEQEPELDGLHQLGVVDAARVLHVDARVPLAERPRIACILRSRPRSGPRREVEHRSWSSLRMSAALSPALFISPSSSPRSAPRASLDLGAPASRAYRPCAGPSAPNTTMSRGEFVPSRLAPWTRRTRLPGGVQPRHRRLVGPTRPGRRCSSGCRPSRSARFGWIGTGSVVGSTPGRRARTP
jgi:hypothetical protein